MSGSTTHSYSRLEQMCQLDIDHPVSVARMTGVVVTIGKRAIFNFVWQVTVIGKSKIKMFKAKIKYMSVSSNVLKN